MSIKTLIAALVLASSSVALADPSAAPDPAKDPQRAWTLLAAENHATKGNADKPTVTDPGILVTAGRTPKQ